MKIFEFVNNVTRSKVHSRETEESQNHNYDDSNYYRFQGTQAHNEIFPLEYECHLFTRSYCQIRVLNIYENGSFGNYGIFGNPRYEFIQS
jgi:hypothetical protein